MPSKANSENCKPAKMVRWFNPLLLLKAGIKLVISNIFGNFADRREIMAALDNNPQSMDFLTSTLDSWKAIETYCQNRHDKEIWVDFISDTGEGYDSTYAVASTVARPNLTLSTGQGQQQYETERGHILILGGDQVYPYPTREEYDKRFRMPFEEAAKDEKDKTNKAASSPHLYAIPGNHDWYDGLSNFLKLFCQQRSIGIWQTYQRRSYFAIPLPHNCWIWGIDIQLASDIDKPQLDYFDSIAKKYMKKGDKVILVTAEPSWVYNEVKYSKDSFDRLDFFVDRYILREKDKGDSPLDFELPLVLTGDWHHYARYENKDGSRQYFTAGGGGAHLHLTNNLPEKIQKEFKYVEINKTGGKSLQQSDGVSLKKTFPDKKTSQRLLLKVLGFAISNWELSGLFASVSIIFNWLLIREINPDRQGGLQNNYWLAFFSNPAIFILAIAFGVSIYLMTDTSTKSSVNARILGVLHGACHFVALVGLSFVCITSSCAFFRLYDICAHNSYCEQVIRVILAMFFTGLISATVFGLYLVLTNLIWGMHVDEASGALRCADYKNFLRIKITKEEIVVYPIGIESAEKCNKQVNSDDSLSKGIFLIENPIVIRLQNQDKT
ncbi:MAG: metallophosphoesterase [Flectobacillus sp.]|uniref:metallophosphoesterase n=1 Tax=Flectobacillus sp. TaxID=50419 RepID=UPI003B99FD71